MYLVKVNLRKDMTVQEKNEAVEEACRWHEFKELRKQLLSQGIKLKMISCTPIEQLASEYAKKYNS